MKIVKQIKLDILKNELDSFDYLKEVKTILEYEGFIILNSNIEDISEQYKNIIKEN